MLNFYNFNNLKIFLFQSESNSITNKEFQLPCLIFLQNIIEQLNEEKNININKDIINIFLQHLNKETEPKKKIFEYLINKINYILYTTKYFIKNYQSKENILKLVTKNIKEKKFNYLSEKFFWAHSAILDKDPKTTITEKDYELIIQNIKKYKNRIDQEPKNSKEKSQKKHFMKEIKAIISQADKEIQTKIIKYLEKQITKEIITYKTTQYKYYLQKILKKYKKNKNKMEYYKIIKIINYIIIFTALSYSIYKVLKKTKKNKFKKNIVIYIVVFIAFLCGVLLLINFFINNIKKKNQIKNNHYINNLLELICREIHQAT